MTTPSLHVTTFNIHKGFSQFNRRMMVHELRDRLRHLNPDIVFLQEVQGLHLGHAENHHNWPSAPQHEFLADEVWQASAYGSNMIYDHGHHGNAILSRFPILDSHNQDVTHLQFEKRGLLHCRIDLPEGPAAHCVCVHLSLFGHSRRRQMRALADYLDKMADPLAPDHHCRRFQRLEQQGGTRSGQPPRPDRSVQPARWSAGAQFPGGHADVPARPDLRSRLQDHQHRSASRPALVGHFRPRRTFGMSQSTWHLTSCRATGSRC